MELNVQVEKPSNILRKLTIRVAAKEVATRFERGLIEVQKTAKLKGFRPGQAPISVIKQYYGEDIKHRLFHSLIDESFQEAVRGEKLQAVGRPKIDTPDHKTGEGDHDHTLHEDKDLTYVATVEILPEIEVKGHTGVSLTREEISIKDEDIEKVVNGLLDSQAELIPVSSGLVNADGQSNSRPAKMGDHVDINFDGGMVTEKGIERRPEMKGNRVLEIGSNSLIEGFEENLIGMRKGESKNFRLNFPKDYHAPDFAGKESEFSVTVNEVKEKKMPELNDEFAKQMGYEDLADLRKKAREYLTKEKTDETDRKLRSELMQSLIEKNPFDVPQALVESQTRALAQDWAEELKKQGADDAMIQGAIMGELEGMKKRADSQVRGSLILEAIAKKEKIEVSDEEFHNELITVATSMKVEPEKLNEFYAKNSDRKEDMLFRMRQERTLKFLLDKAKIKSKS